MWKTAVFKLKCCQQIYSQDLPWGHVMSHKKFEPDRFSRFDVYWIQTNKQTNKQTDKPNLYIEGVLKKLKQKSMFFKGTLSNNFVTRSNMSTANKIPSNNVIT